MNTEFVNACAKAAEGNPSTWLFDLRYDAQKRIHSLFLYHVTSEKLHNAPLPVGQTPSIVFFPDSPAEAAPEIVKALFHVFTTNPHFPMPRMLVTNEELLTRAVNDVLVTIGIPQNILFVRCSPPSHRYLETGYLAWHHRSRPDGEKGTIPAAVRFDDLADAAPVICPSRSKSQDDPPYMREIAAYTEVMENSKPRSLDHSSKNVGEIARECMKHLLARHEGDARRLADSGDAWEQMSYGARLRLGCRSKQDRSLARVYLIKAVTNPNASKAIRTQAHALLIDWCMDRIATNPMTSTRYIHAGFYHANEASRLVGAKHAPARVLAWSDLSWANKHIQGPLRPMLAWQYPFSMQALEERNIKIQKEDDIANTKRVAKPNRYRCANVHCNIEATSGRTLQRCSGKCDQEVKPYYCSSACQKDDWKTHKPFCRKGAPCSVLDSDAYKTTTFGGKSKNGAVHIPLQGPNGLITTISSSDMTPAELKAIGCDGLEEQIRKVGKGGHLRIERGAVNL